MQRTIGERRRDDMPCQDELLSFVQRNMWTKTRPSKAHKFGTQASSIRETQSDVVQYPHTGKSYESTHEGRYQKSSFQMLAVFPETPS